MQKKICQYSPIETQSSQEEKICGVTNAWSEEGISDHDDYSVVNLRTIYYDNRLETKKLEKIGIRDDPIVNMDDSVDLAKPECALRANTQRPTVENSTLRHETQALYCGIILRLCQQHGKYNRKDHS